MNVKFKNVLLTAKKKATTVVLCSALVATMGAGVAYASGSETTEFFGKKLLRTISTDNENTTHPESGKVITKKVFKDAEGGLSGTPEFKSAINGDENCLVKVENGNPSYSTDGGKTWQSGFLEGQVTDGEMIFKDSKVDGEKKSFFGAKKDIDGTTKYTTDGENWSEELPDGFTLNEDGSISSGDSVLPAPNGGLPALPELKDMPAGSENCLVRVENGNASYSTDGGKTWTEGLPDGAVMKEEPNGATTTIFGNMPEGLGSDQLY